MTQDQEQRGIEELTNRLAKGGLNVIEQARPWRHLRSVYFEVGRADRKTSIALTDEFIRDLPATKDYQAAVDSYATAVSGRIRCGSPDLFYCRSHVAISANIIWPIQAAVVGNMFSSWLRIHVTNELQGSIAKCCVNIERQFTYSGRTMFDDIRFAINQVRNAIDTGKVTFYNEESHPGSYQQARNDTTAPSKAKASNDIERFIAGKTYMLSFQVPDVPAETYALDPWDEEYLTVSKKDLSQSAQVLRARGLIDLDSTLSFSRPSDKLLSLGWPAAVEPPVPAPRTQIFQLARLPKKQELLDELKNSLAGSTEAAVIVLDLDQFKQVNDTKGHVEGDACLENVVVAIGTVLGRKGTLYRWGGDEFAVTLPNFSTEEVAITAERIRGAVEKAKTGKDVPVTASVGVCATDHLQNPSAESLLDAADKAMYISKKNGKNRVTIWPIE